MGRRMADGDSLSLFVCFTVTDGGKHRYQGGIKGDAIASAKEMIGSNGRRSGMPKKGAYGQSAASTNDMTVVRDQRKRRQVGWGR
jgi:hypothetical protein